jgi:peptidoglycan/xylan/chitin deacetylase (PgdA/CDA1 family)
MVRGGSAGRFLRSTLEGAGLGRAVEGFDLPGHACLTYDDGPDPSGTREVLEALRAHGAKATFFVLANRVRRHPEVLHEVVSEGHEIALHGADHRDLGRCAPWQVRTLVRDSRHRVEDALGGPIEWYRPPYVSLRLDGWAALRGLGLRFVASGSAIPDWEVDQDDASRIDELRRSLSPGDVVLAHDSWATTDDNALPGPQPEVDRRWLTAQSLLLLEERSLSPLTLSQAQALAEPRTAIRVALRPSPAAPRTHPEGVK